MQIISCPHHFGIRDAKMSQPLKNVDKLKKSNFFYYYFGKMASDKGAQSLNSSAGYTQVVLYTLLYFSQQGKDVTKKCFCWSLNFSWTPVHFIRASTLCPSCDLTTGWPASHLASKQLGTVVVTLAWKGTAGFGADRQAEAFSLRVPVGGLSGQRCRENCWPTWRPPLVAVSRAVCENLQRHIL